MKKLMRSPVNTADGHILKFHYNTRKEYKYATVFALQKTGLTGFP